MDVMFNLQFFNFVIKDIFIVKLFYFKGGEIEFWNVVFVYYFECFIFCDFFFKILVGQKVVIVGLFGCGKFIVFWFFFCFYDFNFG